MSYTNLGFLFDTEAYYTMLTDVDIVMEDAFQACPLVCHRRHMRHCNSTPSLECKSMGHLVFVPGI